MWEKIRRGICQTNEKHVHKKTYQKILIVSLFIIARHWKQSKYLTTGKCIYDWNMLKIWTMSQHKINVIDTHNRLDEFQAFFLAKKKDTDK